MKFSSKVLPAVIALLSLSLPLLVGAQGSDPFRWEINVREKSVKERESVPLGIAFQIPPKHFLYKDKMNLVLLEGIGELDELEFSPSFSKKDPFSGKELEVFEGGAMLKTSLMPMPGSGKGEKNFKLELQYQGCSDQLCYRLMKREIPITLQVGGGAFSPPKAGDQNPFKDQWFIVSLFLSFLGGIATAFTPCVLPVIPITLAFIGVRKQGTEVGKNFYLSLFLVLSMALTYALLGIGAASLGKSLGFLFQNPYFLLFGVVLYVVFALSLLGLFELQFPLGMRNAMAKMGGTGIWGAIAAGFTVGFLAAPCVGPLIGSLLLYVAEQRDLLRGFALLFAYGFGMGSLFLVIGTFYHQLASRIHGGPFMVWVKRIFALLLLVPAVYYGSVAYQQFRHGAIPEAKANSFWILDDEEAFIYAKRKEKPLFVDFFATWCFPCVEMEKRTFSDSGLQSFLQRNFIPLQIDCTQETEQCKRMVERYGVVGWPTFLIISPQGEILRSIIGQSLSAEELQEILKAY